jgi:hypothetical protein
MLVYAYLIVPGWLSLVPLKLLGIVRLMQAEQLDHDIESRDRIS